MLRAISRANFLRSSVPHFAKLFAELLVQSVPWPPIPHQLLTLMIVICFLQRGAVMPKITDSRSSKSKSKPAQKSAFDVQKFLETTGLAKKVVMLKKADVVYSQGD